MHAEATDSAKALRQAASLELKHSLTQFNYSCDGTNLAGHLELFPDVGSLSFAAVDADFPVVAS